MPLPAGVSPSDVDSALASQQQPSLPSGVSQADVDAALSKLQSTSSLPAGVSAADVDAALAKAAPPRVPSTVAGGISGANVGAMVGSAPAANMAALHPGDDPAGDITMDAISHKGYDPANRTMYGTPGDMRTEVKFNDGTIGQYGDASKGGKRQGNLYRTPAIDQPSTTPQMGAPGYVTQPMQMGARTPDSREAQMENFQNWAQTDTGHVVLDVLKRALGQAVSFSEAAQNVNVLNNVVQGPGEMKRFQQGVQTLGGTGMVHDMFQDDRGPIGWLEDQVKNHPKDVAATALLMAVTHGVTKAGLKGAEPYTPEQPPTPEALKYLQRTQQAQQAAHTLAEPQELPKGPPILPKEPALTVSDEGQLAVTGKKLARNAMNEPVAAPLEARPGEAMAPVMEPAQPAPVDEAPTPKPAEGPAPAAPRVVSVPDVYRAAGRETAPLTVAEFADQSGQPYDAARVALINAHVNGDVDNTPGGYRLTQQGRDAQVGQPTPIAHPEDFNVYAQDTGSAGTKPSFAAPEKGVPSSDTLPYISPAGTLEANAAARAAAAFDIHKTLADAMSNGDLIKTGPGTYEIQGSSYQDAHANAGFGVKPNPAPDLSQGTPLEKAINKFGAIADAALARATETKVYGGLPVDALANFGIYVAAKVAQGTLTAANYAAHMIEVAGEQIRPHLNDIWKAAQDILNGKTTAGTVSAGRTKYTGRTRGGPKAPGLPASPPNLHLRTAMPGAPTGRYHLTSVVDHQTGEAIHSLSASDASAAARGALWSKYVLQGLNQKQKDLMMSYLKDVREREIRAAGGTPSGITPMTPGERALVAGDSKIQDALKRHEEVYKEITDMRQYRSPGIRLQRSTGEPFMSLLPVDADGNPLTGTGQGGSVAQKFRRTGTSNAKEATGQAQGYSHDYQQVLTHDFQNEMKNYRLQKAYDTALSTRDSAGNPLMMRVGPRQVPPSTMMFEGEEYPAVPIEDTRNSLFKLYTIKPVHDNIMDAKIPDPILNDRQNAQGLVKLFQGLSDAGTNLALANPGDVTGHVNRTAAIASKMGSTSVIGAASPYLTGPVGARLATLTEMAARDVGAKQNIQTILRIIDANGGSDRPFRHTVQTGAFGKLAQPGHEALFGMPSGRGLNGYDLRLRLQLELIREQLEGNRDPQRIRDFSTQVGMYTSHPVEGLQKLRAAGVLSPYLGTSLPMQWTELRQLAGDSGFKGLSPGNKVASFGRTAIAGVGGALVTHIAANYMLSGHYPWQNAPGHTTDLDTGHKDKDGGEIYVNGTDLYPDTMRVLRNIGVESDIDSRKPVDAGRAIQNSEYGPLNAAASAMVTPVGQAVTIGITGKTPSHITPSGMYQVAKQAPRANLLEQEKNNAVAGVGSANRILSYFLPDQNQASGTLQSPGGAIGQGIADILMNNLIKKEPTKAERFSDTPRIKQIYDTVMGKK